MGTWCHDSKREVPRAIKLFNLLALENERIKIVALNKQKKGYFKNYKSFNIKRTPTIIFFLTYVILDTFKRYKIFLIGRNNNAFV